MEVKITKECKIGRNVFKKGDTVKVSSSIAKQLVEKGEAKIAKPDKQDA